MDFGNLSAVVPQADLPNPFTPLAFLPVDLANQVAITRYIVVGSASVFVWDILNSLREDYLLLFKYPVRAPTFAYFLSRLGSLGFVLNCAITLTAPVGICETIEKISLWLYPLAICSTALLFFFRVRAVFDNNKVVVTFFAIFWIAVLTSTVATPIEGVTGNNIGPTKYCLIGSIQSYVAMAAIIPAVNDTLIFLAITWRLMGYTHVDYSVRTGFRTLAFGDYMLPFSKALLQDGQKYYLATVTTSLMTVVMFFLDALTPGYRVMFTVTNITMMNIMACRVFRNVKLGLNKETEFASSGVMHMVSIGQNYSRRRAFSASSILPIRFAPNPVGEQASGKTRQRSNSSGDIHYGGEGPGARYTHNKNGVDEVV